MAAFAVIGRFWRGIDGFAAGLFGLEQLGEAGDA